MASTKALAQNQVKLKQKQKGMCGEHIDSSIDAADLAHLLLKDGNDVRMKMNSSVNLCVCACWPSSGLAHRQRKGPFSGAKQNSRSLNVIQQFTGKQYLSLINILTMKIPLIS